MLKGVSISFTNKAIRDSRLRPGAAIWRIRQNKRLWFCTIVWKHDIIHITGSI